MRQQVTQLKCGRCGREEILQGDAGDRGFTAKMGGLEVHYDDLCTPCMGIITRALESVGKPMKKNSPVRSNGATKEEPPVKPVTPPPPLRAPRG